MPAKADTYVRIFPLDVTEGDARAYVNDEIKARGLKPTKTVDVEVAYDLLGNEVRLVTFKAYS